MKKINLLLMAMGSVMLLSLASCDPCKDVTCDNDGECVDGDCDCAENYYGDACETFCMNGTYADGTCTCDEGYEGDGCDTESRTKFIASYNSSDNCTSGTYTYEQNITAGSNEVNEILVSNFGGFSSTITAIVDGDMFSVTDQVDASGRKFTATGTIASSGNSITVTYTVTFSDGSTDECTTTMNKK